MDSQHVPIVPSQTLDMAAQVESIATAAPWPMVFLGLFRFRDDFVTW
jgi:hypothetical protein